MKAYRLLKCSIGLCIALLALSGCSFFQDSQQVEKTADQLIADGNSAFEDEDYKDAIKAYTDLKDWYPFSRFAILAELRIADAHFELEEYDQAIVAYELFEKLHPKNEALPYVIYQTGLCWFNRMDTVDRDPSRATKALLRFRRLVDQYPDSPYAEKAKANIGACIDNLAGHELLVADYYFKTKSYPSALKRYEYLVEHYPDTEQSRRALNRIPECIEKMKDQE